MKKKIALVAVFASVIVWGIAWGSWYGRAKPSEMLELSDLNNTSVSYSWTGGFSFGNCDVHAAFSGDGQASLQVGDHKQVSKTISSKRYRQLLSCMAENRFSQIKVKRRWGLYQCDIGRYEVVLRDAHKKTVVYADGKHYIENPELLESIFEMIYSFEAEFGHPLAYGPIATTCIPDNLEITAMISASFFLLCCIGASGFIWIRKRYKKRAKLITAPKASLQ